MPYGLNFRFPPSFRGAGENWSPADLFANGEQGALYYFTEDFAGLYQDAAGTTPVTAVGQPVGLMLDRRFGLAQGPELLTNGDFSGGMTGVMVESGTAVISNGALRITAVGETDGSVRLNFPATVGRTYECTFDVVAAGNDLLFKAGDSTHAGSSSALQAGAGGAGRKRFIFRSSHATDGFSSVGFIVWGYDSTAVVDNISVRELPGNHARQPTTTARPALRSGPLRIDYDGVDDLLRTVFPALGSNVTIARSIPGVGAQILTGQTIVAGNWDDNVDSCAVLVIDRALTGPETALVTAFLNQQAGV